VTDAVIVSTARASIGEAYAVIIVVPALGRDPYAATSLEAR
jgi:hypothetical protein